MDDIRQTAIDRFQAYLARRQFSAHTIASYTLDLRLFFAAIAVPLARVSFHEVDQFVEGPWPPPRNLQVARKASRRPLSTCGSLSPWWPSLIATSIGSRARPALRPTAA